MTAPLLFIVKVTPDGDGLNVTIASQATADTVDTGIAPGRPQVTLRDLTGRVHELQARDAPGDPGGQFTFHAAVGLPPPGSDPPSYVLTINGAEEHWFAPPSAPAAAAGGSAPITARAGSPDNDYRGRDYTFFVELMRASIAQQVGGDMKWALDQPADPLTTLVEGLAFGADHLSFRQDAAGTEAYLPTARKRLSLRRHARMRDYAINDGCTARTPLVLTVSADGYLRAGTSAISLQPGVVGVSLSKTQPLAPATTVYETIAPLSAKVANNDLGTYLAGKTVVTLPAGTIALQLNTPVTTLTPGALLVLEQPDPPAGGVAFGTHVMRLLRVEPHDKGTLLTWHPEDALPRPLTIPFPNTPGQVMLSANVVLADHGRWVDLPVTLPAVGSDRYEPEVALADPVLAPPPPAIAAGFDGSQDVVAASLLVPSARASLAPDPRTAVLALELASNGPGTQPGAGPNGAPIAGPDGPTWRARPDLLDMPGTAPCFAATLESGTGADARRIRLRFGDGVFGRRPAAGTVFTVRARTGDGVSGRVRPGTLVQTWGAPAWVTGVTNPLSAAPSASETDAAIRLFAASSFMINQRGVTPDDWEALAAADPLVVHAKARTKAKDGGPCSIGLTTTEPHEESFLIAEARLLEAAVLGAEPSIVPAKTIAVKLAFSVYCRGGADPGLVRARLRQQFGSGHAADGTAAYFHPSRWPLGRAVGLTELIAAIAQDPGVADVVTDDTLDPRLLFERLDQHHTTHDNLRVGAIPVAPNEQVRLGSDPAAPGEGGFIFYVVAAA